MRVKLLAAPFLILFVLLAIPATSNAGLIFSVAIAPPVLPVYVQPICPGDGYIWVPGYWAYSDDGGYFWVPGTWVLAPEPGFLWTPGWWGWSEGFYVFHRGYWGPHVGFYGGINYGFGYGGFGYDGGYWRDGAFFYNRSVNNVVNVTNVYNKTVIVNNVRNVSYNGGNGGITARPTAREEEAARDRHINPTQVQMQHVERASTNRQSFESQNHGRPSIAATSRPSEFSGRGVVNARSAGPSYRPPNSRSVTPSGGGRGNVSGGGTVSGRGTVSGGGVYHPNQLPSIQRSTPNTGNPRTDQRYQQQQQKFYNKQQQERQNLQRKQDQEHQRVEQRRGNDVQRQQMEQKHQQQTQQLQQRQTQQQQRFEQKRKH